MTQEERRLMRRLISTLNLCSAYLAKAIADDELQNTALSVRCAHRRTRAAIEEAEAYLATGGQDEQAQQ